MSIDDENNNNKDNNKDNNEYEMTKEKQQEGR
jgi:hypothetical protein